MGAKVIGNRGAYGYGNGGIGQSQVADQSLNWVVVLGDSEGGGVGYVSAAGFNAHQTRLGYYAQGDGTLSFTLDPESLACSEDPTAQEMVTWMPFTAVASPNLVPLVDPTTHLPLVFTAIKVVVAAGKKVIIAGR